MLDYDGLKQFWVETATHSIVCHNLPQFIVSRTHLVLWQMLPTTSLDRRAADDILCYGDLCISLTMCRESYHVEKTSLPLPFEDEC
jgi:hypothetical protein